jgi:histidinol-phosphatase (PHP family)
LYAAENFIFENFETEFNALLKAIAERELAMEINTATFGRVFENEKLMQKICHRFHKLGGKFCTIGSDAHVAEHLARHFDTAREIASEAKLIPVYFKERKRIVCG